MEGPGVGAVAQEAQPGLDVQAVAGEPAVGADAGEAGDVAVEGAPVTACDGAGRAAGDGPEQAARGEQLQQHRLAEQVGGGHVSSCAQGEQLDVAGGGRGGRRGWHHAFFDGDAFGQQAFCAQRGVQAQQTGVLVQAAGQQAGEI